MEITSQKYGRSQIRAGLIEDMDRNLQWRKKAKEFDEEAIKEFQGLLQEITRGKAEKGIK